MKLNGLDSENGVLIDAVKKNERSNDLSNFQRLL